MRRYATEHYVDALFSERRAQTDATQHAAERAVDSAQHAADALSRHQNEFRGALDDAQERFVEKDYYDARHSELERRLANMEADHVELGERVANLLGRGAVMTAMIAITASAIVGLIVHAAGV